MDVNGRPVEEWRRQAFDFAADSTKQLITVATGVVTITVLFSKDLDSTSRGWALAAWVTLLFSIGFGLFGLLTLSGNLHNAAIGECRTPSLNTWDVNFFSLWQCILFIFGMIFVLVFGFYAIRVHVPPDKPLSVNCVVQPLNPAVSPKPQKISTLPTQCKKSTHRKKCCSITSHKTSRP